jgi:sugar phosphate isomerase/epimerase
MRFGVQLKSLQTGLQFAIPFAAKLGIDSVELDARRDVNLAELSGTGMRQIRKWLDDAQLKLSSVRYGTRRALYHPEDLERRVAGLKSAMRFAHAMGCELVVNQVGRIPEDENDPNRQLLAELLEDLGSYGLRAGAFLSCETGAEPLPVLHQFLQGLRDTPIGITLNPGNLIANGFGIQGVLQASPWIRLVHAKDAVYDRSMNRGSSVAMGSGEVDFPQLLGDLEEGHYSGMYVIEQEKMESPLLELQRAIQYLRSL